MLLDQSFLAGVGNYLRSEILYSAGLHWSDTLEQLRAEQITDLARAARTMMWRSVKTGGVTNDPERVKVLKRAGWRRRDYRHYVFSREGQACFECDLNGCLFNNTAGDPAGSPKGGTSELSTNPEHAAER